MKFFSLLALIVCCAGVFSEIINVTDELSEIVEARVVAALERLRLLPEGIPLTLVRVNSINYEPGKIELIIDATLESSTLEGEQECRLSLIEDVEETLDVVCGERKWRVITPAVARLVELENELARWIDSDAAELKVLEGRVIRSIIRLQDEHRLSVLLLPAKVVSAHRQSSSLGTRIIIEARLGIPSRKCEIEIIERHHHNERVIITCGEHQWELE